MWKIWLGVIAAFVVIAAFLPGGSGHVVEGNDARVFLTKKIMVRVPEAASSLREMPASLGGSPAVTPKSVAPAREALARNSTVPSPARNGSRKLARTAEVGLVVNDVDVAIARVIALARRNGGDVVHLADTTPATPGQRHTAELTLSIPEDRFDGALGTVAEIGTLASRSITTEDLSDKLVDASARLRNLRREERDLRAIMDRSGKIQEVLDVEQQLSTVRDAIETLDAQRATMEVRVLDATIVVSLESAVTTSTQAPTAFAQIADAWRAALLVVQSFSIALAARIFIAIAFVPYLALAALAAFTIRRAVVRKKLA